MNTAIMICIGIVVITETPAFKNEINECFTDTGSSVT